jgi:uncharacterized membrane protein YhaH (DUF805 family)/DNA-binding XRE family transcriptional regulator
MTRHSYQERDYAFGQVMLKLRTNIGLTQAGLANLLGVSRRAVGEWEAGSNYPKAEHLQHFIGLCVQQHVFAPEREEEQIRALLDQKISPVSFSLMSVVINLLSITIGASLDMRRFHDIGKSGYFLFFTLTPVMLYRIIGYISHGFDFNRAYLGDITPFVAATYWVILVNDAAWVGYLLLMHGDRNSNRYGSPQFLKYDF